MVVAEGFPGGASDGGVVESVRIERGDEVTSVRSTKGGAIILHVHLAIAVRGAVSFAVRVEGVGYAAERVACGILWGRAFSKLARLPGGVIFFEGGREVDLQAAPLGVGV